MGVDSYSLFSGCRLHKERIIDAILDAEAAVVAVIVQKEIIAAVRFVPVDR
jgi:hypothetical protein|tara:strand:- start:113 stop:265 length:153 start_codon:yes stop_codon:yes gene_type:complete